MEFDRHASAYEEQIAAAVGFSGRPHAFFLRRKADLLRRVAAEHLGPTGSLEVLDVGCGTGAMGAYLLADFAAVFASDVALQPLLRARRAAPAAHFAQAAGERSPFRPATFDVAAVVCVLHHVILAARPALVAEMADAVRPGGLVAVFEHNPWNPLTRRVVSRCGFDQDARLLGARQARRLLRAAGLVGVRSHHLLLVPWSGRAAAWLERRLDRLPLGAQYLAWGRRPLRRDDRAVEAAPSR